MTVYQMPVWELQSLPGLAQVEVRLKEFSQGNDRLTAEFSAAVTDGGKRLRPALVLLCGAFYRAKQDVLIDLATAVELIHTASLVHDDIVDRAATRRGKPTLSKRWGEHQAVLYGDFLFARAFSLLSKHGLSGTLGEMTEAISLMCEGEIEQSSLLFNCDVTEAEYFSYIHKKTAYFLSACCLAGAEACGMPAAEKKLLAGFGLQLGYAFQLTDDLLDISGNAAGMGKPAMQDLKAGYLTLPLIKLLRDKRHGCAVRRLITEKDFSAANIQFIHQALTQCGILEETNEHAGLLLDRAKQNLGKLPLKPPRLLLTRLADYLSRRTS
ncbi:MAG: polyprenyl synthetase family protein [Dethiobacter sp.]|nr:polyprenyl synthetase family protein [Dethiobacter sp.]MBS3898744.1 polyprenyl synthetase family protein [Dethiobacter sp.]MBS3983578.1 polyprenyl synthetase family protein [Dethiobacter sp.]MCL4462586.1 polyprenyl synthetase family protein [Bacillota bacterium]